MRRSAKAGFSLVEILIALIIIAILGSVVVLQIAEEPDKARVVAAKAELKTLSAAVDLYRANTGAYPSQAEGLQRLVDAGSYLQVNALPLDPWGGAYVYLIPGRNRENYEILCYGADRQPGGEGFDADLSSRQP